MIALHQEMATMIAGDHVIDYDYQLWLPYFCNKYMSFKKKLAAETDNHILLFSVNCSKMSL